MSIELPSERATVEQLAATFQLLPGDQVDLRTSNDELLTICVVRSVQDLPPTADRLPSTLYATEQSPVAKLLLELIHRAARDQAATVELARRGVVRLDGFYRPNP